MSNSNEDLKKAAKKFLEAKDQESGTMWTEDDWDIVQALVDFHLQQSKNQPLPIEGEDELEKIAIKFWEQDSILVDFSTFLPFEHNSSDIKDLAKMFYIEGYKAALKNK